MFRHSFILSFLKTRCSQVLIAMFAKMEMKILKLIFDVVEFFRHVLPEAVSDTR